MSGDASPRIRDAADWREESRHLAPDVRHRVQDAVRAGRALDDREEAALAVGCARAWRRRMLVAIAALPVLAAVAVITAVAEGASITAPIRWLPLAGVVLVTVFTWRRSAIAEERNRMVATAAGDPPDAGSPLAG